jgi:hypothetical protein
MAQATLTGPEAVRKLGQKVLFTWLGKIFYGLMHRELFLAFNRRDPGEGSITSPKLIETFSLHHLFLQNVRVPMEFKGDFPASIFVYETLEPPDPRHRWDFHDSLPNLFISVRVGRTGLIGVLQDGGVQAGMRRHLRDFFRFPLHPVQHSELAAQICYKSLLATHVPKYVMFESASRQPVIVVQTPVGGLSGTVRFRDWSWRQYASVLAQFTHMPVEALHNPAGDSVVTWIRKPDGTLNQVGPDSFALTIVGDEDQAPPSARQRRACVPPRAGRPR